MASKWRLNCWEYGLNQAGIHLCSPYLTQPLLLLCAGTLSGLSYPAEFGYAGLDQGYQYVGSPTRLHPTYPYGYQVVPDVH